MPFIKGSVAPLTAIRHGSTAINEIRRGTTLVWAASLLRDNFNDDRGIGLGAAWTDHGPAVTPNLASVINEQYARINLPDGVNVISGQRSRWRYNLATAPTDDGYLEIKIATRGDWDGTFSTTAFSHLSNSAFTDGVGINLRGSRLRITCMLASTETDKADCGGFVPGDVCRLVHTNGGTLHQMFRNGRLVGAWDGTGVASVGSGFRSTGLSVYGRKDSILTPRRYSPGIDYIEAGAGDARIRTMATTSPVFFNKRSLSIPFTDYTPAENDLILLFVTTTDAIGSGFTPPAGWVALPGASVVASDSNVAYGAYHLVTAAEAAAVQTSWPLPNFLNSPVNAGTAAAVFRGVNPATPIDAVATGFNSSNTAYPHVFPGISGSQLSNRSLVVGFVGADGGPVYNAPPPGWEQIVRGRATQIGRAMCVRTALTQAGVDVLPASIAPSFADEYAAFTVALTELPSS